MMKKIGRQKEKMAKFSFGAKSGFDSSGLKTRSGLASFYIVTFVTLILSIVVLSFVQIVINDSRRSSDNDLYQSAYDSALAGVEDARVALVKYHECLKQGGDDCARIKKYVENGKDDCDSVAKALGRIDESESKEVPIVEKSNNDSSGSISMEQAYTCATVDINVPDYRGVLSSTDRVYLIPIRVLGSPNDVKNINVAWTSDAVKEEGYKYRYPETYNTDLNGSNHTYFYPSSERHIYQPITVDIYQTDDQYTLGEMTTNNYSTKGTDHASIVLQPAENGDHYISSDDVLNQNDKYNNYPEATKCDGKGEFNCYTTIQLPNTYRGRGRNKDTFLLRIETPYGQEAIDFAITLMDASGNAINFSGVQASIDSTGRANDLVRRVETRVDFFTDFPYPEFALQLNPAAGQDNVLTKNYAIADNCWYSINDGAKECSNVSNASGYNSF